jgi:hypothetical protein
MTDPAPAPERPPDVVDQEGRWRYLEEVPMGVRLTRGDVERTAWLLTSAPWVSVQLQQPPGAARAAVRAAALTVGHPGGRPGRAGKVFS